MFGLFESKQARKDRLVMKGARAMSNGDFAGAERSFIASIGIEPWNAADAWIGLGSLHWAAKNLEKARDCFKSAMSQRSSSFEAIRGLAHVEKLLVNEARAHELFLRLKEDFKVNLAEDPAVQQNPSWFKENMLI